MSDRTLLRPRDDVAVLAYRANGRRDGAEPYQAICTSVLLRTAKGWQTVQHRQTLMP